MKVQKNKKPTADTREFVGQAKSANNLTRPAGFGYVELYHSQDVKLSQNYQSASATYGVKLIVLDNPKAIKEGIKRAEQLVEAPLCLKVQEQHTMLGELSK